MIEAWTAGPGTRGGGEEGGRLRIGIDGYNLAMPTGTGIATYGFALAETLKRGGFGVEGVFGIDAGPDPALRETLFFDRFGREPRVEGPALAPAYWPAYRPRARDVPLTPEVDRRALADRWPRFDRLVTAPRLFALAHRHFATFGRFVPLTMPDPPDVMHWTYPVPIRLVGARNVYTLHDVVPLKLPYATLTAKRAYRARVQACIDHAAHLCTVSEASRADVMRAFGVAPERITNTWQAAPPLPDAPADDADAAALERTFGLSPRGYFLFFGAIEPKKNLGRLIEAHLSRRTDTPLVIVGGKGWQSEGETGLLDPDASLGTAHAQALAGRVMRLGHLSRALLVRLIRNAKAVTFPSIAEGFGLPVLEAMQLGTPVLTSRDGALGEVAGDAALLVDPFDTGDIAGGLRALDDDEVLRAGLAAAGPVRAAMFSQDAYLARLREVYARAQA